MQLIFQKIIDSRLSPEEPPIILTLSDILGSKFYSGNRHYPIIMEQNWLPDNSYFLSRTVLTQTEWAFLIIIDEHKLL